MLNLLKIINQFLTNLGGNTLFIGFAMIFLNIGSRYIEINLSKNQEILLKNISKEILIFTIAFIGTRDIFASLILTFIYLFLTNFILNENSKFCVLPEQYKKLHNVLDRNNDNFISQDEINKAIEILDKAKKQDDLNNQFTMMNSLNNTF